MEEKSLLLEHERLDDLQNGYMLIQNPKQFCFGIDAVLLSWFACVKPGEEVLDMGTGTGIVPVLLKATQRAFYRSGNTGRKRRRSQKKCTVQSPGKRHYDYNRRH